MSADFRLDLPHRPRRLRQSASRRALVRETSLTPADLIAPLFVVEGKAAPDEIASMPGVFRLNVKDLVKECRALAKLGVPAVALFPKLDPRLKDAVGGEALNLGTLVLRAVRAVKAALPELTVITDVALDPYTTHGHDGVLTAAGDDVANDATVERLVQMAVLQAEAGVDFVAPSDMMDGRVGAIRQGLDAAGHTDVGILAYSSKFNSAYYGPFRDAVGSAKAAGTRLLSKATYQLDPANRRRGDRRGAHRRGGRRRHRHGETGRGLPRHHPRGARCRDETGGGLSSVGRIRPDPRGGPAGLARPHTHARRVAAGDQTRRRRHDPNLLRKGRGQGPRLNRQRRSSSTTNER
jgi:porphobilinogen synthase